MCSRHTVTCFSRICVLNTTRIAATKEQLSQEQTRKSASAKRKHSVTTAENASLTKSSSVSKPKLRSSKRRKASPDVIFRPDTLNFPSGDIYTGATRDGKPHGYGKMTFKVDKVDKDSHAPPNGSPDTSGTCFYWEGEWNKGNKHGK